MPPDQHHGWKFTAFGPDGRLYTNIGEPCNICPFDRDRFALIISFRPDGSDRRIEARGIRNSVGFDWHAVTRELWATNNGRDWAGNDEPHDTLHRIRRPGEDHGFPWCVGTWGDPAMARRQCSEFEQPAASLGPHTAPLGMPFYTGTMFPEAYRGAIFVARRGSWNREAKIGYFVAGPRRSPRPFPAPRSPPRRNRPSSAPPATARAACRHWKTCPRSPTSRRRSSPCR